MHRTVGRSGHFERLRQSRYGSGLVFAMNAGMFHESRTPVGLYIENGRTLKDADLKDGAGNFYMKPNGVFFVAGQSAGILETSRFLAEHRHVDFATQSGPMLVIDGAVHPKISPNGASRLIRNGVGIRNEHTAIFAISNDPVSFGRFAQLFRDRLDCANALYFDGVVSGLYAPALGREDHTPPLGPMVGALPR